MINIESHEQYIGSWHLGKNNHTFQASWNYDLIAASVYSLKFKLEVWPKKIEHRLYESLAVYD